MLKRVEPIGEFEALRTIPIELPNRRVVPVLELDQLIEVKSFLTRPKDRIVAAELRAIRDRLD